MATLKENYEALVEGIEFSTDQKVEQVQKKVNKTEKDLKNKMTSLVSTVNNAVSSVDNKIDNRIKEFPTLNNRPINGEKYLDKNVNIQIPPMDIDGAIIEDENAKYTLTLVSGTDAQDYIDNPPEDYEYYWPVLNNKKQYIYAGQTFNARPGDLMVARVDCEFKRPIDKGPISFQRIDDNYDYNQSYYDEYINGAYNHFSYGSSYNHGWCPAVEYNVPTSSDENYYYGIRTGLFYKYAQLDKEIFTLIDNQELKIELFSFSNITDVKFIGASECAANPSSEQYLYFTNEINGDFYDKGISYETNINYIDIYSFYTDLPSRYWNYELTTGGMQYTANDNYNNDTSQLVTSQYYDSFNYTPCRLHLRLYSSQPTYFFTTNDQSSFNIGCGSRVSVGEKVFQTGISTGAYAKYQNYLFYKKEFKNVVTEDSVNEKISALLNKSASIVYFEPHSIPLEYLQKDDPCSFSITNKFGNCTYKGDKITNRYILYQIFNEDNTSYRDANVRSPEDMSAQLPIIMYKDGESDITGTTITLKYAGKFKISSTDHILLEGSIAPNSSIGIKKPKIVQFYITTVNVQTSIYTIDGEKAFLVDTNNQTISLGNLETEGYNTTGYVYTSYNTPLTEYELIRSCVKLNLTIENSNVSTTVNGTVTHPTVTRTLYAKYKNTVSNGTYDVYVYQADWPQDIFLGKTNPPRTVTIERWYQTSPSSSKAWVTKMTINAVNSIDSNTYTLPTINLYPYDTNEVVGSTNSYITFDTPFDEIVNKIVIVPISCKENGGGITTLALRYVGYQYNENLLDANYTYAAYWPKGTTDYTHEELVGDRMVVVGMNHNGGYYNITATDYSTPT